MGLALSANQSFQRYIKVFVQSVPPEKTCPKSPQYVSDSPDIVAAAVKSQLCFLANVSTPNRFENKLPVYTAVFHKSTYHVLMEHISMESS